MSFSSRDTNIFPIVGIGTTVGTNILPDLQTWSSSVLEGGFPVFSFHPFANRWDGDGQGNLTLSGLGLDNIETYIFSFEVSIQTGGLEPFFGSTNSLGAITQGGTYSFTVQPSGDDEISFSSNSDFNGYIKNISVIPFVPEFYLSTNSVTLNGNYYKPLLLNVPSLKESIDLEKRNYKISNVNLDISNFPHEGVRFSEMVEGSSLINKEVNISWVSHTVQKNIYSGVIRRYTHDDEKVRLAVEDRSQATLHKDFPLNYLTGDDVPDKYKNKPIPMVYGHVDRSPCVFTIEQVQGSPDELSLKSIVADSLGIHSFIDEQIQTPQMGSLDIYGALYIGNSDGYAHCARIFNYGLSTELYELNFVAVGESNSNYSYDEQSAKISLNDYYENDAKKGVLRGILTRVPREVKQDSNASNGENYFAGSGWGGIAIQNHNITQYTAGGTNNAYATNDNWGLGIYSNTGLAMNRVINNNIDEGCFLRGEVAGSHPIDGTYGNEYLSLKIELEPSSSNFDVDTYFIGAFFHNHGYVIDWVGSSQWKNVGVRMWRGEYFVHGSNILPSTGVQWFNNTSYADNNQPSPFTVKLEGTITGGNPSNITDFNIGVPKFSVSGSSAPDAMAHVDIWSANIFHVSYIDKLLDRDFYANVKGRVMQNNELSPKAPQLISHLLTEELGVDNILDFTDSELLYDWQYAFTIDKKINSKKLLENISAASPYIPRFNNRGEFKFDVIKSEYSESQDTITIQESDCIKWSYSKTKIEDVYSKIEFKYKWDYARGEFGAEPIVMDVNDLEQFDVDDTYFEYYGLPNDHSESTLVIDDNRGKCIRNEYTAIEYTKWMLYWHCNQHLKIKVKLPLKHLDVEIGNLINFDKVLGDVKPYGIDYSQGAVFPDENENEYLGSNINFSQAYSLFMCISTNKTLEYVEIECIQLHKLKDDTYTARGAVLGCTDENAFNHDPTANADDGSCILFNDPSIYSSYCPLEVHPEDNLDHSDNYAGDENLYDENGNQLPNVFILTGVDDEAIITAAKIYYNEVSKDIVIYSWANCEWTDTVVHQIDSIAVEYKDLNGDYISAGSFTSENSTIELQLPEEMVNNYSTNGLEVRITYNFNTDQTPTFANDAELQRNYEYNYVPISETAITSESNPYGDDGKFVEDLTFSNDLMQSLGDSEIRMWHKLEIHASQDYTEIGLTNNFLTIIKAQSSEALLGDLTGDGVLNILDVVALLNLLLSGGASAEDHPSADMNEDGVLNVLDLVALVGIILAGG